MCNGRLWCIALIMFFVFKKKTAYELRISDWSSDVCSSDLANDFKSALIRADLQEADTGKPEKAQIFYQQEMTSLGNIRGRFESKTKYRSEERRVGKECVSSCSARCSPYH